MDLTNFLQSSQEVLLNSSRLGNGLNHLSTLGPDPELYFDFVSFLFALLFAVPYCFIFKKAGKPWWTALIPLYNIIVLLEIIGRPWWWIFLLFIPIINIYFGIKTDILLAKSFGKTENFAAGLVILGPIFLAILAFGKATYQGPVPRTQKKEKKK